MAMKYILIVILILCLFREYGAGSGDSKERVPCTGHCSPTVPVRGDLNDPEYRLAWLREVFDVAHAGYEEIYGTYHPPASSQPSPSEPSPSEPSDKPPKSRLCPLCWLFPSRLEKFVHENIENVDDNWISESEPSELEALCAKINKLKFFGMYPKVKCSHREIDGRIVYKKLKNVDPDSAKLLFCDCKKTKPFYLIEMESPEKEERSNYLSIHYIYLQPNKKSEENDEYVIQNGWKVRVKKNDDNEE